MTDPHSSVGRRNADILKLGRAIKGCPLSALNQTLCRGVRYRYLAGPDPQPLYFRGSSDYGGRYTPIGGPSGLYLAYDQATIFAELQDLVQDSAGGTLPLRGNGPTLVVEVAVRVERLLDLTIGSTLDALGVTEAGIRGEWRSGMELYEEGRGPMPLTQQIGFAAHATGVVHAIKFPSARMAGRPCLVVFPDRLDKACEFVEVIDPHGNFRGRLP